MEIPAHPSFPTYSVVRRDRTPRDAEDCQILEDSPEIECLRNNIQPELLSESRRPKDNEPLLVTLFSEASGDPNCVKGINFFTKTLQDSQPCLLAFSSPFRAADYARIHAKTMALRAMHSSPDEFVRMICDLLRISTVRRLALDVCPHCETFPAVSPSTSFNAETAVRLWAIHKSCELARESFYFACASDAFTQGDLRKAKITGLKVVEHVTAESPRLYLLLGKIALSLGEEELFSAACHFLEYLNADEALQDLRASQKSSEIASRKHGGRRFLARLRLGK